MIAILVKPPGRKKYYPFDYRNSKIVINKIYQTMWPNKYKDHVTSLICYMNENNPGYNFKLQEIK